MPLNCNIAIRVPLFSIRYFLFNLKDLYFSHSPSLYNENIWTQPSVKCVMSVPVCEGKNADFCEHAS